MASFETNVIFSDKEVKVAEIAVLKKTEETSTTDEARSNKAIDEEIDDLVRFKDKWTNQSKNNVDNLIEYGLVEGGWREGWQFFTKREQQV